MTTHARQRGFTLGETLAALAVVGIGMSLAVPGLRSLAGDSLQAASVNELVSTMHLARSEAVTRNERVTVCASSDGVTCDGHPWEQGWIAFLDTDADATRGASEVLLDRVTALTGLQIRSAELGTAFSYRPNGRAVAVSGAPVTGNFVFCEAGADTAARVVILRANGLPTLSDREQDGSRAACPRA